MIRPIRRISTPIHVPAESQPETVNARSLLSLQDFSNRHYISPGSLRSILLAGRIIPTVLGPDGDYYMINFEQYDGYRFGRWPDKRPIRPIEPAPKNQLAAEMIKPRRLVTVSGFARMRGVTLPTIITYMTDGKIEATRLGPEGQYTFIDLDRYETLPIGRV